jgi:hypothetical protein
MTEKERALAKSRAERDAKLAQIRSEAGKTFICIYEDPEQNDDENYRGVAVDEANFKIESVFGMKILNDCQDLPLVISKVHPNTWASSRSL